MIAASSSWIAPAQWLSLLPGQSPKLQTIYTLGDQVLLSLAMIHPFRTCVNKFGGSEPDSRLMIKLKGRMFEADSYLNISQDGEEILRNQAPGKSNYQKGTIGSVFSPLRSVLDHFHISD